MQCLLSLGAASARDGKQRVRVRKQSLGWEAERLSWKQRIWAGKQIGWAGSRKSGLGGESGLGIRCFLPIPLACKTIQ